MRRGLGEIAVLWLLSTQGRSLIGRRYRNNFRPFSWFVPIQEPEVFIVYGKPKHGFLGIFKPEFTFFYGFKSPNPNGQSADLFPGFLEIDST